MNLNLNLPLKDVPLAAATLRRLRGAALRFALHEAGVLLCASVPLLLRAGEKLQRRHATPPAPIPERRDEPESFDF